MIKKILICLVLLSIYIPLSVEAKPFLSKKFCKHPDFYCKVIWYKNKERKIWHQWQDFWPDKRERLIVKKFNRLNMWLVPGITIVVPKNLAGKTYMDFSPVPKKIVTTEKVFIWYPKMLAFGAYDDKGNLLNWGPALGGRQVCKEKKRSCKTPSGTFEVLAKGTYYSRSISYPKNCKGLECSWMPYFVRITNDGVGIHGSKYFIGRHDSHGCVRLFISDARWLNKYFFTSVKNKVQKGTKVIFLPY